MACRQECTAPCGEHLCMQCGMRPRAASNTAAELERPASSSSPALCSFRGTRWDGQKMAPLETHPAEESVGLGSVEL